MLPGRLLLCALLTSWAAQAAEPKTAEGSSEPPLPAPESAAPAAGAVVRHGPSPWQERLELGVATGAAHRRASTGTASYRAGFEYGLYLRVRFLDWLHVRALSTTGTVPVTLGADPLGACTTLGASECATTRFSQKSFTLYTIGAALEPTWNVSSRFQVWGSLGIAWGRHSSSGLTTEPTTPDGLRLSGAERVGVFLQYSLGLGAGYELIPRWLRVSARVSYGIFSADNGSQHRSVQTFDQRGRRLELGGFPFFDDAVLFHGFVGMPF